MSDGVAARRGQRARRPPFSMFPSKGGDEELEFLAHSSSNRRPIGESNNFDGDTDSVMISAVTEEDEDGQEDEEVDEEGEEGLDLEVEREGDSVYDERKSFDELEILSPIKLTTKLVAKDDTSNIPPTIMKGVMVLAASGGTENGANRTAGNRKNKVEFAQFDTVDHLYGMDRDDDIQAKIFNEIRK